LRRYVYSPLRTHMTADSTLASTHVVRCRRVIGDHKLLFHTCSEPAIAGLTRLTAPQHVFTCMLQPTYRLGSAPATPAADCIISGWHLLKDHCLYCPLHVAGTVMGRFTVTDPNVGGVRRDVREVVVASPGYVLCSLDCKYRSVSVLHCLSSPASAKTVPCKPTFLVATVHRRWT
jgi:hypothetical protein